MAARIAGSRVLVTGGVAALAVCSRRRRWHAAHELYTQEHETQPRYRLATSIQFGLMSPALRMLQRVRKCRPINSARCVRAERSGQCSSLMAAARWSSSCRSRRGLPIR
jgi:hypothetical protein